jgi:hypothetical protein
MAYVKTGKPRGRKPGPNKKPLEVNPPEGKFRPVKPIDWKLVDTLLLAGCLGNEIASHFDMHPTTFYGRVEQQYGMSFTNYSSEKKSKGESLLRHKQYEVAMKGDKTMLVWLGKNRLGQKETEERNSVAPNDTYLTTIIAELKSMKEKPNGTS